MSTDTLDLATLFAPLKSFAADLEQVENERARLKNQSLEIEKRRMACGAGILFQTFPDLESFSVTGEYCSDDEGGSYFSVNTEYPTLSIGDYDLDGEFLDEVKYAKKVDPDDELETAARAALPVREAVFRFLDGISSELWEDFSTESFTFTREGLEPGWGKKLLWKDGELLESEAVA